MLLNKKKKQQFCSLLSFEERKRKETKICIEPNNWRMDVVYIILCLLSYLDYYVVCVTFVSLIIIVNCCEGNTTKLY